MGTRGLHLSLLAIAAIFQFSVLSTFAFAESVDAPAPSGGQFRCLTPPDRECVSGTGVIGHGSSDGFGAFSVRMDLESVYWEIAPQCSISVDWQALLGKRARLRGCTVLVAGGISGHTLGTALGVSELEVVTPASRTSWGNLRMLYR